jgi:hypothetical protein
MDERYIKILAHKTEDGKFIPFWQLNTRAVEKYECVYIQHYLNKKDSEYNNVRVDEVSWDMVEQKVIIGPVIDIYPSEKDIMHGKYKIGQEVFTNTQHDGIIRKNKIIDIKYLEHESTFKKATELDDSDIKRYPDKLNNLLARDIVEFRYWKPTYIMEHGQNINYAHQIFLLEE